VGDGVTDNWVTLQRAITLAQPGTTIYFPPGVYKISNTLNIHQPLTLRGDGATILFGGNELGGYRHFTVSSVDYHKTPGGVAWRGIVRAGDNTFRVALPVDRFKPGDPVYVWLGQDPNDLTLPHYSGVATIVANTGNTVTLDRAIPYDIRQGTRVHEIFPMPNGILQDVTIRDLRLDQVDGAILDMNISVERARNIRIENITGRAGNLVNVADSEDVVANNIDVDLLANHRAGGRVLTAWQAERVTLSNVRARTTADMPVVFLESWARHTTISNVDITWGYAAQPLSAVMHLTGGSYGTFIDNMVVRNVGPIMLVGSGTQKSEYQFGALEVTGPVISLPVYLTQKLTLGGRAYTEIGASRRQFTLKPNTLERFPVHSGGLLRAIRVSITGKTGVRNVYLLNTANQGADLLPLLTAGQVFDVAAVGFFGSNHAFNDAAGSDKTVSVLTGADLPPGTVLTVEVEYYR
jgi:hypothetical protein